MRFALALSLVVFVVACSSPQSTAPSPAAVAPLRPTVKTAPAATVSVAPPAPSFQQRCRAKGYTFCSTIEVYTDYAPADSWMAVAEKVDLTANPPVFEIVTGYGSIEAEASAKVEGGL